MDTTVVESLAEALIQAVAATEDPSRAEIAEAAAQKPAGIEYAVEDLDKAAKQTIQTGAEQPAMIEPEYVDPSAQADYVRNVNEALYTLATVEAGQGRSLLESSLNSLDNNNSEFGRSFANEFTATLTAINGGVAVEPADYRHVIAKNLSDDSLVNLLAVGDRSYGIPGQELLVTGLEGEGPRHAEFAQNMFTGALSQTVADNPDINWGALQDELMRYGRAGLDRAHGQWEYYLGDNGIYRDTLNAGIQSFQNTWDAVDEPWVEPDVSGLTEADIEKCEWMARDPNVQYRNIANMPTVAECEAGGIEVN